MSGLLAKGREPRREIAAPGSRSQGRAAEILQAGLRHRHPLLLMDPTGCGKAGFDRHMAWWQDRLPVTLACQGAVTATELGAVDYPGGAMR